MTTYILATSHGAKMLSFDSLAAAISAREIHGKRFTRPLRIIEQTIREREVV